ncbi:TetR/AcrR family transcriptional regulator [Psychrobacillus sp. FSL K6-4046]|uniref:TetR/AcrR family transcriptional regulator n=1 Tax=Psychrobacillus sp. FSL K6-4046 TaxID=2921550 RepID=UPI0026264989|nr:TetR/AcrR family transcriptional regulator [uncultured Psychrobacillus sp.]
MSTTKKDPRAMRSQRMLKEALVALLNEKTDLQALTVKKVADKAELNRATFYLHFVDLNDLLKDLVKDIFSDLEEKLKPLLLLESSNERTQLLSYLDYFYNHRIMFSVLFKEDRFKRKMHKEIKSFIKARRTTRQVLDGPERVSLDILASAMFGVIEWWLEEGTEHSSEYIVNQIELLFRR